MLYSLFLFTEQPISSMRLLLFTCLIKQRTIDVTMLAIEFRWGEEKEPYLCLREREGGEGKMASAFREKTYNSYKRGRTDRRVRG